MFEGTILFFKKDSEYVDSIPNDKIIFIQPTEVFGDEIGLKSILAVENSGDVYIESYSSDLKQIESVSRIQGDHVLYGSSLIVDNEGDEDTLRIFKILILKGTMQYCEIFKEIKNSNKERIELLSRIRKSISFYGSKKYKYIFKPINILTNILFKPFIYLFGIAYVILSKVNECLKFK